MPLQVRLIVFWLMVVLCACGEQGAFLFLQVSGVPSAARSILIYPSLNGSPANERLFLSVPPKNQTLTAGLRLASPVEGELIVDLGVFDAQGCLLAVGQQKVLLTAVDTYREVMAALTETPAHDLGAACGSTDPVFFAVQPSSIRTTGRDEQRTPVPLQLRGWGFVPEMKIFIGARQQPPPRVISFQEAVIDAPQVGGELGPTRVVLELPGQRPLVLENALTVLMTPFRSELLEMPLPVTSLPVLDIAAGDFNGDGLADFAVIDSGGVISFVTYRQATGLTVSQWFVNLIVTPPQASLLAGDLDQDGLDDLVVVTPGQTMVYYGHATGPLLSAPTGPSPSGLDGGLADMDGDGFIDLVLAGDSIGLNTISVYKNARNRSFSTTPSMRVMERAEAMRIADMNGDTIPDVIALTPTNDVIILLNLGSELKTQLRFPLGTGCSGYTPSLSVADLDDDGKLDVLVNGSATPILAPLTDLKLRYIDGVPSCFGGLAMAAADWNGDGSVDLAWLRDDAVVKLPQSKTGQIHGPFGGVWSMRSLGKKPAAQAPRHLPALDLNGDGTIDLITGHGVLLTVPQ